MGDRPLNRQHSRALEAGERPVAAGPTEPLDRSHLLRRSSSFPFPNMLDDIDPIRLRRRRRVSASFRRIPPLARNGRL